MAMPTTNITTVFESLRETFKKQDTVRDLLREKREAAEVHIRAAQHELISFHTTNNLKEASKKIFESLKKTGKGLMDIESVLPENTSSSSHITSTKQYSTFYRYADLWSSLRQMLSMICVVVEFIDSNQLADIDRIQYLCGNEQFKLPLEDYLYGVCNAISEFVRLSMNRVIMMDYYTPTRCTIFATHVFEAFRELNFKNDFLRKRYDGIKYDIKKLEEIVYDLSIRGLINVKSHPKTLPPPPPPTTSPSTIPSSDIKHESSSTKTEKVEDNDNNNNNKKNNDKDNVNEEIEPDVKSVNVDMDTAE